MPVDAKWDVPKDYDLIEREVVLPPPRGSLGAQPLLGILSVRALEDQAAGEGVLSLVAWQTLAGATTNALQTIERIANKMEMGGLELLMLGHAYVATGLGEGAGFEVAQRARKILKQPVTPYSIDASLLLAVTALPYGAERVRTLLEMLEPELQHGTDEHRAVHALLRAAADPDQPARLDDAFTFFATLDDQLGLAQCALVAYAREAATTKRAADMRAYLEHAIFRYDADGRPEWASRAIVQLLIPLLVDEIKAPPDVIIEQLARAAGFAVQAKSQLAIEAVFRTAGKLGYAATVTALSAFDPPTFAKRDAAAAPPAEAPAAKPKKTATKKPSKKKSAS
ncbi:MAG TPA: hypothetical protein VMZ53_09765 [Kofleriaceae bacterium]|nr:hypothetical protein [Kofleriaceae bacterium]